MTDRFECKSEVIILDDPYAKLSAEQIEVQRVKAAEWFRSCIAMDGVVAVIAGCIYDHGPQK
jgi:hypothetical protein